MIKRKLASYITFKKEELSTRLWNCKCFIITYCKNSLKHLECILLFSGYLMWLKSPYLAVGEIVNYYYLQGGKIFTAIFFLLSFVIPVIVRVLKISMNVQYKGAVVTYDLKIKLLIWVTYYLALSNSQFPERAMSFEVLILNILSIMISISIVVFLYKLFIEPQPSPEFIAGIRVIGVGRAIRVSEENKDEQNQ